MTIKTRTPFADKFFQVNRRVTYYVLGNDQQLIFEHFREFDLSGADCHRLFNATGIDVATGDWLIGEFDEPVIVCGLLYPKHTVAVFQGRTSGSRFVLFSVDDTENVRRDYLEDTLEQQPHNDEASHLVIRESPEILPLTEEEKESGLHLWKKGTIGDEYEYEMKARNKTSNDGLYDQNIIFLRVTAQRSGIPNQVLVEFMNGDWHILIPNAPNDLLMHAIDKLVDYYAPNN